MMHPVLSEASSSPSPSQVQILIFPPVHPSQTEGRGEVERTLARGVRAKQGRRRRVLQGVSIPPPPPLPHPSSGPTTPSYFPLLQSRAPSLHSSSPQTRTTTLHSTRNNCFCLEGVRGGGKGGAHGLPLWRKKGVFEGQPVTSPFACILFLLRLLLLRFSPLSPPPRSARLPPSSTPSPCPFFLL